MTKKRDLKRLARERQARTGEAYVTPLHHVRGPRPGAIPVSEYIDITEVGELLGMECRVMLLPELAERIDVATTLRQLRSVLLTTTPDPAFDLMRAVVLRGEHPRRPPPALDEGLRFLVRLRAGIGGVCPSGRIVAFTVWGRAGARQVVFVLWLTPFRYAHLPPILVVTSADFWLGDADGELDVLPYRYLAGIP